jgi:hypothetical protein
VFLSLSPGSNVNIGPAPTLRDSLSCIVLLNRSAVVFGAIDGEPVWTFVGHACKADESGDVEDHFCLGEVEYTITICNEGAGVEMTESVIFIFSDDDSLLVLKIFLSPTVGTELPGPENDPNNSIDITNESVIDVCTEREYAVNIDVTAVGPNTGMFVYAVALHEMCK